MSIRTYIYGVPQGFKTFGAPPALAEYFKGFYIKSRTGRRLMVHRLSNGETRYSFLIYDGVLEYRRQRSFFGMTIITDNAAYCTDLPMLYAGLNQLYDFVASHGELGLFTNEITDGNGTTHTLADGLVRFATPEFDSVADGVHKVQALMEQIFRKCVEQTATGHYDASFANDLSGKMPSFNPETSASAIIDSFRRYRWVILSSSVAKPNNVTGTQEPEFEVDITSLKERYNEINAALVDISYNTQAHSLSSTLLTLQGFEQECSDKLLLIRHAKQKLDPTDSESLSGYGEMTQLYDKQLTIIDKAIAQHRSVKVSQPTQYTTPTPPTAQPHPKPAPKPTPKPSHKPEGTDWFGELLEHSRLILAGILLLIIVVVSMMLVRCDGSTAMERVPEEDPQAKESMAEIIRDLREAIETKNFEKANTIATERLTEKIHNDTVTDAITKAIKEQIADNPYLDLTSCYTENFNLFTKTNYNFGNNQPSFEGLATAAKFIDNLGNTVSQSDKDKALGYLTTYAPYLNNRSQKVLAKEVIVQQPSKETINNRVDNALKSHGELPDSITIEWDKGSKTAAKRGSSQRPTYSFLIANIPIRTLITIKGIDHSRMKLTEPKNNVDIEYNLGDIRLITPGTPPRITLSIDDKADIIITITSVTQ